MQSFEAAAYELRQSTHPWLTAIQPGIVEQPGECNFSRRTDTDREHYVLGNNPIEINLAMWCSGNIGPDDIAWKMIDQFLSNRHGFGSERESAFAIPVFSTCFLDQTINLLF